ncbi:MAG TPA: DUF4136 domain-containing protein [Steroidobacteraceae bacterium]
MKILSRTPRRGHSTRLAVAMILPLALALTACQTHPQVRTQSAPELNVLSYRTFGFVHRPDTDKSDYRTLTTRYLEDAVTREMLARGYTISDRPDLEVNFIVGMKDKIESYPAGVGYGGWHHGFGWWGYGPNDIYTVTEGSVRIDVVDRNQHALVWSGTAAGIVTDKALKDPEPAITKAVDAIFAKYPKQPLVANVK